MTQDNKDIENPRGPRQPSSEDVNPAAGQVSSKIVGVERRAPGHTVFRVDENIFTSTLPRATHWSIAWSDLMMTMFVLFLSMFVYQMAEKPFLKEGGQEILGGDTTEALQILDDDSATLPFPPIKSGPPLISTGTIKKIEPVPILPAEPPAPAVPSPAKEVVPNTPVAPEEPDPPIDKIIENIALVFEQQKQEQHLKNIPSDTVPADTVPTDRSPAGEVLQPRPLKAEKVPPPVSDSFQEMYRLSKGALENNKLGKFASIDIVPDKTVRIILTGDLLFALGQSDLSANAKASLTKIAGIIKNTPYMINVVGHTDNIPMSSARFKNNWELSLARANTVSQFLIETIGMNPNQFVVSGYSSYRPTIPNSSAENRAKNRRVEVIISKRLPTPQTASPQNLN